MLRVPDRDRFMAHLDGHGIATGIHLPIPCHLQPVYSAHPQSHPGSLPVTEAICADIVSIPVHPHLTDAEVGRVISAVCSYEP